MYAQYFKHETESKFHTIPDAMDDCWIHIENATSHDINQVSKVLEIDPEDIQDSLDMMEISRIERLEPETFAVFARFPYMHEFGLYTATLTLIVTKNTFTTICPTTCHLIQKILAENSHLATRMRSQLISHCLLKIVHEYTRVIKRVRQEVIIHEKDMSKVTDEEITNLTKQEENLNQCHSALQPMKRVIEELLSGKYTTLDEKDQDLLEDLLLATDQAEELCRLSLSMISSLRNSVQVVVTNQFNRTIRLLTALTIILNFPTTISSIYGMNISLPLEKNPWAFSIILFFIISVSIGAFVFFQRRRWL